VFQKIRNRYQAWLDGTDQASPYQRAEVTQITAIEPARSRVADPSPYRQLPVQQVPTRSSGEVTLTLRRVHAQMDLRPEVKTAELPAPWITRQQRAYEATLSPTSRQLLDEMDRVVARAIVDMRRFTDELHGLPVGRKEHETPQYQRRHARNMAAIGQDILDNVPPAELVRRIVDRAKDIDGPPTGLIPVIKLELEEEAWA